MEAPADAKAELQGGSKSCGKVTGGVRSLSARFCIGGEDDREAMRPLKHLGEESRRKSAPPTYLQHLLCELRYQDPSSDWTDEDEGSTKSFLSTPVQNGAGDEEEGNPSETKAAKAEAGFRLGRRLGRWQGKVDLALRRSMALDTTISPAKR